MGQPLEAICKAAVRDNGLRVWRLIVPRLPMQQTEEGHAKRPDVRSRARPRPLPNLVSDVVAVPGLGAVAEEKVVGDEAEVAYLCHAFRIDEHVAGLDVAVNHPVAMREREGVGDLRRDAGRLHRQEHGTYFIVMEYVEGRSLREILRTQGRIPPLQAAGIAAEIADALAFAHRHGVVHRDIKPGNVLITPQGQVKVTDFGIAANPTDAGAGLTQTGAVMGTATYFSPEQAQGFAVDGRTDVYALGVVLYEMVTGEAPFQAESPVAVAMKHVRELPVPPSNLVPDLPMDLERIILAAMAKSVNARYQSAEAMREQNLRPALPPRVEIVSAAEGADLEYKISLELLPEMPEPDFASLGLEKLVAEAPEEDVDRAVERACNGS